MKRTGHNHHTVLRWARRFAAEASLQDRARTGRPVTRTTRELVFSIRRLVKGKRGQSTRRTAATIRARGTPISKSTVWRVLKSDGLAPYVEPQAPLQRFGDKQRRLRFAAQQKGRDWRRLLMRRHLCVFPVPINVCGVGQMPALLFFGESYCTVVCLDPRVNDATGSARLVRRRTLDLCAGQ